MGYAINTILLSPVVTNITVTQPAGGAAYAALDTVSTSGGTSYTFTGIVSAIGKEGIITKARIFSSNSANVARYKLHLYDAAPTAIADNAPYTVLYADRTSRQLAITFPALATEGSGSTASYANLLDANMYFKTNASANIFGLLEILDAYTPAAGSETIFIELTTITLS